jgi:hypothetical protein
VGWVCGQILCEHQRFVERSHHQPPRTVYDWRHYLAVIQRKPGTLRNGAPFLELPEVFRRLQHDLLKRPGGDREMVEILALSFSTTSPYQIAAETCATTAIRDAMTKGRSSSPGFRLPPKPRPFARGSALRRNET